MAHDGGTAAADTGRLQLRMATTDAERDAVARFRYQIYVDELGRYRGRADHEERRLVDPEDERSWIPYLVDGGEVVASTRATWGGAGFSARQIRQYQLEPFLAEVPAERMLVGERTMIASRWRGTDVFTVLTSACEALSTEHDVRVIFGACEPHLIPYYARYQRPYGTRNINSEEAGLLVPLVSFPAGVDALRDLGGGGTLPRCVQDAVEASGTVECPLLVGAEPYARRVLDAVRALDRTVFDGLDEAAILRCIERSSVVTCHAGDRLIKVGGSARNPFVVLRGALLVSRDGLAVGQVAAGEIVGELASLLGQPRGCDVDVVEDDTVVLSLSVRTFGRLADVDPVAAARLASNISRQLGRRLAAAAR